MSPRVGSPTSLPAGSSAADHLVAIRSVIASAWHGLAHAAVSSPWFAIALMVPAIALLVGCTRLTVRRG